MLPIERCIRRSPAHSVRMPAAESAGTPPDQTVGTSCRHLTSNPLLNCTRGRLRVRWLADHFGHDETGPRLRAMADELEAEAAALDVAGKNDEATR